MISKRQNATTTTGTPDSALVAYMGGLAGAACLAVEEMLELLRRCDLRANAAGLATTVDGRVAGLQDACGAVRNAIKVAANTVGKK